jgi:hypothetical protein
MKLSLKTTSEMRAASPGLQAGPHIASFCCNSAPLGVTTPFFTPQAFLSHWKGSTHVHQFGVDQVDQFEARLF